MISFVATLALGISGLGSYSADSSIEGGLDLVIEFHERGTVVAALAVEEAPVTVEHVRKLVDDGFYNGILVHRVAPEFVVQFGNPDTKTLTSEEVRAMPHDRGMTIGLESGAHPTTVAFETVGLRHERGTLGMALSSPGSDTGSSHIFINLSDNFRLDGQYVVFGKVSEGMNVVDSIRRGDAIVSAKIIER